nr:4-diphosphocytidyl-2C-methyl-D-erythritol kinase [uncultured Dethiosulfovibrio sp.]
MIWGLASEAKINLTLRIVGARDDGYHRLVSVFKKLPPIERLSLEILPEGMEDRIAMSEVKISDVNLVQKVIDFLRERGAPIPPLSVSISKVVPPGTGLGAGTGNGAAVLRWATAFFDLPSVWDLSPLGADLPFLVSDDRMAMVSGIGERFSPMEDISLRSVLIVPSWRCNTAESYRLLDDLYAPDSWPLSEEDGELEALDVLGRLRSGLKVGLLPNDFIAPLTDMHREYEVLFDACDRSGAVAWGISGSGSSVFALYDFNSLSSELFRSFDGIGCVEKIIFLE